ncbi:MAG: ABC transporter ATP-binding protein/permease [Alphaproteobacteria bacterium]|nr:ABC transporter ATP-binding protein/permease [Alphaproteobacteria bacterium]
MRRFPDVTVGTAHFSTLKTFLGYLWPKDNPQIKTRVVLAFSFLFLAKLAHVIVPFVYKEIVDYFAPVTGVKPLVIPVILIVIYGLVRLSTSFFTELRDVTFRFIEQWITRFMGLAVFKHLHKLSLRFHLDRKTGALNRAIERGIKGIEYLTFFSTFNILPTLLEIILISGVIAFMFGFAFSLTIIIPLILYIIFTVTITEWRNKFQRVMNQQENDANAHTIDSLLNYETVKYFSNEEAEEKRFDSFLEKYQKAALSNQKSLSILNFGQSVIIVCGITLAMVLASIKLLNQTITMGDFVLINTYLFQLYIPLNFLGTAYRTIKQSLVNLEEMTSLLEVSQEIKDRDNAIDLPPLGGEIKFENVSFHYDPDRAILKNISFTLPKGQTIAIVGPSGAGKSTISRLLFRFYDVIQGSIKIDGQDIRDLSQKSLRNAIGIVPQDTVLFNDSIYYNIAYGKILTDVSEIHLAAKLAHIDRFIESLPQKYQTMVGERGLKLSGGEKQRVAIARVILKNPMILLFDEATSALDSKTEKEIQHNLKEISKDRTTLIIAHRLSTIIDADKIIVLDHGEIIEEGTHQELLALGGLYATMWARQQESSGLREKLQEVEQESPELPRL